VVVSVVLSLRVERSNLREADQFPPLQTAALGR
jgi:hypothetical protein